MQLGFWVTVAAFVVAAGVAININVLAIVDQD